MRYFNLLVIGMCLYYSLIGQEKLTRDKYAIYYDPSDRVQALAIDKYANEGIDRITSELGIDYDKKPSIYLYKSREALDKQWQDAWGMPDFKSQCWMVGSGLLGRLDLLSPRVWVEQACEHDPYNQEEIRKLVWHELTHVLHSDHSVSPAFDDINNIDWFVEGLATYLSGQLDTERMSDLKKYLNETGGPKQLSLFWTGQHKYGLSGSMVAFIDFYYGRKATQKMVEMNDLNDMLKLLDTTEDELILKWRENIDLLKIH